MIPSLSLTHLSLLLLLLHTVVATYLLRRKADALADWRLNVFVTAVGQFVASGIALAGAFACAAVLSIQFGGSRASFLAASAGLFLIFWGGAQLALISLMARRVKRRFLFPWKLRRIGLLTISSVLVVYSYVSIAGFGAWYYTNWKSRQGEQQRVEQPAVSLPAPAPERP